MNIIVVVMYVALIATVNELNVSVLLYFRTVLGE
jgi:hypothetical protein